jgi:hypothetical protein
MRPQAATMATTAERMPLYGACSDSGWLNETASDSNRHKARLGAGISGSFSLSM